MIKWVGLCLLLCFFYTAHALQNKIIDIQIKSFPKSTSILFSQTEKELPNVFVLQNPHRLVVDFEKTKLGLNLKKIRFNSLIKTVRSGTPRSHTLRLVFDLNWNVQYKIRDDKKSKKVLVEIAASQKNGVAVPSFSSKKNGVYTPYRPMIVVIDPGHGGKDPGALGELGTEEKTVVLAIAKELADKINRTSSMRAVLTRQGDYFVSLRDRLIRARKGKADLFIAIHADSYFNKRADGASVYALSKHGATSVAARWLADRDNHSELGDVDLNDLNDQSYVLRSVLIDMAQTATVTDSLRLGTVMLDALDRVTDLHYTKVEQAPFMVLKSPDIPSVLIELGFISNRKEEQHLRDKAYQRKMADALFNGIRLYQKRYGQSGF